MLIAVLLTVGMGATLIGARYDEDKIFYAGVLIMLGGLFAGILALASPDCASGALAGAAYINACG